MATLIKAPKTAKRAAAGETVSVRIGDGLRSARVIETRSVGKRRMVRVEMTASKPEDALVMELPEGWVIP